MKEKRSFGFSCLTAWAFAFGCALGWDAFVLPWTTFLPKAGPLGTVLGVVIGGAMMSVIAWNYHFMINRRPGPGGAYAYVTEFLDVDRGFICGWFLCFAYMSIIWLDAMVLAYFIQHASGMNFHFGFHYFVAGYEVCLVHILISILTIAIATAICCRRRLAGVVQTVLALLFVLCILVCFGAAVFRHEGGIQTLAPAFAPNGGHPLVQILGIVVLTPWLFIGFESISHTSGEFGFPHRKSFGIMAAAIAAVVVAYILLSLIPTLLPLLATGRDNWPDAVASIVPGTENDIAYGTMGRNIRGGGRIVVAVTFVVAVFTNLVGNTVAASRLLAAMADGATLPPWFGRRNGDGSPRNAVLAITGLSLLVFLLGETVIGVVVDIALLGAALAYAYTSAATFVAARKAGDRLAKATGLAGTILSASLILLFVLPVFSSHVSTMSTQSFFVIVCWCIAGLIAFLGIFHHDRRRRFGKSPVAWVVFFSTIVVMSVLWVRQATYQTTEKTFDEIVDLHDEICLHDDHDGPFSPEHVALRNALRGRQATLSTAILRNSYVQTFLTFSALVLMLSILRVIRQREREAEEEKARAKSYFFSTVSHDIRTPLNAIVGFSEMLREGFQTEEERRQAVDSILMSGKTLLALINDILDLSKLESSTMAIRPEPTDCPKLAQDVLEVFRAAATKAGLALRCRTGEMPRLMLDPQRLRQIVFNLLGNAVKFTEKGYVELRADYVRKAGAKDGVFRLEVEDTGCGISEEDLKRIASPYVQVGSKISRNGGTGLGLAICRQLAASMGGTLEAVSTLGKGSTFSVTIPHVAAAAESGDGAGHDDHAPREPHGAEPPRPAMRVRRILLVDDAKMNLMVLSARLKRLGDFEIATAPDGNEALALLKASGALPVDLILTDMWMPNLDGEGLVKAIRNDPALAPLRVMVVTADVELQGRYREMGFDGILLKPITSAALGALLREEN